MPLGSGCFAWLRPKKALPPGEATIRLAYLRYQLEEEVPRQEVCESPKLFAQYLALTTYCLQEKEHKKEVESMQSEMKDLRVHITTLQHALAATQVIRSKLQSCESRRCDEQT